MTDEFTNRLSNSLIFLILFPLFLILGAFELLTTFGWFLILGSTWSEIVLKHSYSWQYCCFWSGNRAPEAESASDGYT